MTIPLTKFLAENVTPQNFFKKCIAYLSWCSVRQKLFNGVPISAKNVPA
jgi:hypothetical protein